jgi:hypothetical protein
MRDAFYLDRIITVISMERRIGERKSLLLNEFLMRVASFTRAIPDSNPAADQPGELLVAHSSGFR